jgi:hypothetical protein
MDRARRQLVEECLGLLMIGGAEALPEPTVDGGEEIVDASRHRDHVVKLAFSDRAE